MTARCLTMAALQTDWDKVLVRSAACAERDGNCALERAI